MCPDSQSTSLPKRSERCTEGCVTTQDHMIQKMSVNPIQYGKGHYPPPP